MAGNRLLELVGGGGRKEGKGGRETKIFTWAGDEVGPRHSEDSSRGVRGKVSSEK